MVLDSLFWVCMFSVGVFCMREFRVAFVRWVSGWVSLDGLVLGDWQFACLACLAGWLLFLLVWSALFVLVFGYLLFLLLRLFEFDWFMVCCL